jgi:UDP-N-acetylglucosamine--N-acetylmuramyl-(pentapeptide) pyrophosphoryl-undecaprenol N-acetylglucosamine transferase
MIVAAGTGGHVFPGIALAQEFKKQGLDICWLGSAGGMEKQWVTKAKIPFKSITIKGLRGNGLLGWLTAPINILKAIFQASKIIKQQQPDLVLGMGGFVCGPTGVAAKLLGIKLVVHEQNAIPGLTNKLLAKIANLIVTAFPQQKITGKNVIELGNPVREGLEKIPILTKNNQQFTILIIGGSRGALAINEIMPKVLKSLITDKKINVIHQTGKKTLQQTLGFYKRENLDTKQYKVVSFIDEMIHAYVKADLVICRSGALTVSELIASARPAIMIPFPFAVDDHQTANAQILVDLGGGEIIKQNKLTTSLLVKTINFWLNNDKNILASSLIRKQSKKKASNKIVKKILEL